MKGSKVIFNSIDDYIATFPQEIQKKLEELRATIKVAAPNAEEKIAYHMPTFALNGKLVLFAAYKNHFGFFGTSYAILEALRGELSIYANEKGSLKFPIDKPLPLKLIGKIVKLRVAENLKNAKINSNKEK